MSGDSDVEMGEECHETSGDIEMVDAHCQTTEDINMADATPEPCSNGASCEINGRFRKESISESGGADSSKECASLKVRDNSVKESMEKPHSVAVQGNHIPGRKENEEPHSEQAKGKHKFSKDIVEEPPSTPWKHTDKAEEACSKESLLPLGKSGDNPTNGNTEEKRLGSIGGRNAFSKGIIEEPQLSPKKYNDKKAEECFRDRKQVSSLVNGKDKTVKETIDKQQSAIAEKRETSVKESVKEPVEGTENSLGRMKVVVDDYKSTTGSVETPQSPNLKKRDEFRRENSEERKLAAMKLQDEPASDSSTKSEPATMSFEDMVKEMEGNAMNFERDKEDKFEMVLVAREKEKNSNKIHPQEETIAMWRKAAEKESGKLHEGCCHMNASCQESVEWMKTEGLAPYKVTDEPHQADVDRGRNKDSSGIRRMEEKGKVGNQPYVDTQIRHNFLHKGKTLGPNTNQAVFNGGNGSSQLLGNLENPQKHTAEESKVETNQGGRTPYTYTDESRQQILDKGRNVGSPDKRLIDDREKKRNEFYNNTQTLQTFQHEDAATTNPYKEQAVGNRGNGSFQPISNLDNPQRHTAKESKDETNQGGRSPYSYTVKPCQQNLDKGESVGSPSRRSVDEREKKTKEFHYDTRTRQTLGHEGAATTNLHKNQERNRSSPGESPSKGSDYGMQRYQNSQGTGYRQPDNYSGCKDYAYGGCSYNSMSPNYRSRSKDMNKSHNRGREQSWRSTHNHYSSSGERSTVGQNNSYNDALDPSTLVHVLSEYCDFRASLLELMEGEGLQPAAVRETVNAHSQVFQVVGETVECRPKLSICNGHIGSNGCQSKDTCCELHICPVYLRSYCTNDDDCVLGHKWFTRHNKHVLQSFHMQDLSVHILRKITKLVTNSSAHFGQLEICKAYNERNCNKRNCDDIHICRSFVAGRSKCSRSDCSLNHNILSSECSELLKNHGFSTNEAPRDVVLALLSANPSIAPTLSDKQLGNSPGKNSSDKISSNSSHTKASPMKMKGNDSDNNSSRQGKSSKVVWAHHFQGDSILAEICFYSVDSKCRNENSGCTRLHSTLHYHWQVSEQGTNWFNLSLHQVTALEQAFCEPAQEGIILPQIDPSKLSPNLKGLLNVIGPDSWRANFEAMVMTNRDYSKVLYIRRLCTERIIGKTLQANTYVWYFLDKNDKWVRYGKVDSAGEKNLVSSVTSAEIERHFCKNPNVPLIFQNAAFKYSLDFAKMTQRNQQTKVIRRVRRRPEPHIKIGKKSWSLFS